MKVQLEHGLIVQIDEGQRQMILLALAELAVRRPGFDFALGEVASKLGGSEMFAGFKAHK